MSFYFPWRNSRSHVPGSSWSGLSSGGSGHGLWLNGTWAAIGSVPVCAVHCTGFAVLMSCSCVALCLSPISVELLLCFVLLRNLFFFRMNKYVYMPISICLRIQVTLCFFRAYNCPFVYTDLLLLFVLFFMYEGICICSWVTVFFHVHMCIGMCTSPCDCSTTLNIYMGDLLFVTCISVYVHMRYLMFVPFCYVYWCYSIYF